jgi:hypothetical protein
MKKLVGILSSCLLVGVLARDGSGADPAVALGEVSAEAANRDDVDVRALRAMAAEALQNLDDARLPRGAHAVLSVSLVRLSSSSSASAEVACVVSATLRDRKRGAVFAVLEGSARGKDEPRRLRTLERATLRAALESAVARVPEAMQRRGL